MGPVKESGLPPANKAAEAFEHAMGAWDEAAAHVAVAALGRSAKPEAVFELLFR